MREFKIEQQRVCKSNNFSGCWNLPIDGFMVEPISWFILSIFAATLGTLFPKPPLQKVKWCTVGNDEKTKCDKWSAVSRGRVGCATAYTTEQCIIMILVRTFPSAFSFHLDSSIWPLCIFGQTLVEMLGYYLWEISIRWNLNILWESVSFHKYLDLGGKKV